MEGVWTMQRALAALGLLAGCATLLDGTTQEIHVASRPRGATVRVENGGVVLAAARTPALLEIPRAEPVGGDPRVRMIFEMDGYEPIVEEYEIAPNESDPPLASVFTLGLGPIVDRTTGAAWAIRERGRGRKPLETVRVDLVPLPPPP